MNLENSTHNENRYYEKIGSIQQSMHEREKRRLELERELFAYSLSDTRISQIKCAKLRSYLKEICEREKRAKTRNLELLRDVKCIEMSLKEYGPSLATLQQQKAEHLDRISNFMAGRKKREQKSNEQKVDSAHTLNQRCPDAQVTEDLDRVPPETSVGRLQSCSGGAKAVAASTPSHRASASSAAAAVHRSPITHTPSPQHPPSGLLNDHRVCREAATAGPANLSDDIYQGNGGSPDGCDPSVRRERTAPAPASGRTVTSEAARGEDEHSPSPPATSTRPPQSALFASDLSPVWYKNPPADAVAHQSPVVEEKDVTHSVAQTFSGEESQEVPGEGEGNLSEASSSVLSVSSASDLSISLTESEPEDALSDDGGYLHGRGSVASPSPARRSSSPVAPQRSSMAASRSHADSRPTERTAERLTHEGLYYLLESIEGRLRDCHADAYLASLIEDSKLNAIISLCNRGALSVSDADLEECSAVVLRELQRLCWSTARGCLLPWDLVESQKGSPQPQDISSRLPPDGAGLWDRWFKHALLLKERRVIGTERLLELFTPLLLPRHATYGHQAKVLLRTLLSRSREECAKEEEQQQQQQQEEEEEEEERRSDSSSSHSRKLEEAPTSRPPQDPGTQALQSGGEDSQDESPVESIPIRETRAYQLLKQSAEQKWLPASGGLEDEDEEEEEEGEDNALPGTNDGGEEDPGWAKHSSHQDPYPWKKINNTKPGLSKAVWGNSDDSNSDIEAALRPRAFNAKNNNEDDSDDFFD